MSFLLALMLSYFPFKGVPLPVTMPSIIAQETEVMREEGLLNDEEEEPPKPDAEEPILGDFARLGYFILSVLLVGLIAWLVGAAPSRKKKEES
ncbi:MAG: hypothetical protein AB7F75_01660 [Planctomycetota bacterium]